jgi:hypothetical protein
MLRTVSLTFLTLTLTGNLGCGGRDAGTGGADSGSDSSSVGSVSPDTGAPSPCGSTLVEAGTVSASDAGVPMFHRPSVACCPTQRGPGPPNQPYPPGVASACCASGSSCADLCCTSDSDCTGGPNGRCSPEEGLEGTGGCTYDQCFTDSDCPSKAPCLCRSSPSESSQNTCASPGGNCAIDSDCGPGGYCSPSSESCGSDPYYCHTAQDTCINSTDCPAPDAGGCGFAVCAYDPQAKHWACGQLVCCPP